jgi:hypothetical protein
MLASMSLRIRSLRGGLSRSPNKFDLSRAFPHFLGDVQRHGAMGCRSVWMDLPQLHDLWCLRQALGE